MAPVSTNTTYTGLDPNPGAVRRDSKKTVSVTTCWAAAFAICVCVVWFWFAFIVHDSSTKTLGSTLNPPSSFSEQILQPSASPLSQVKIQEEESWNSPGPDPGLSLAITTTDTGDPHSSISALDTKKEITDANTKAKDRDFITVHSLPNFFGEQKSFEIPQDPNDCSVIPKKWLKRIRSVNTHGNCVCFCVSADCGGRCERVAPNTKGHNHIRLYKSIRAIKKCSAGKEKSRSLWC